MVEYLKSVYERAQSVDKFDMRRQPKVAHTWNTPMASTYWDLRLGVACAATDAEFQNRLMARDQALTSPSWSGSPTPTPTGCRATAAGWTPSRRLIGPWRWRASGTDYRAESAEKNGERARVFEEFTHALLLQALCLPQYYTLPGPRQPPTQHATTDFKCEICVATLSFSLSKGVTGEFCVQNKAVLMRPLSLNLILFGSALSSPDEYFFKDIFGCGSALWLNLCKVRTKEDSKLASKLTLRPLERLLFLP
jgi:hypothetical protein